MSAPLRKVTPEELALIRKIIERHREVLERLSRR